MQIASVSFLLISSGMVMSNSNVDDPKTLQGILAAVKSLASALPVFFPIHPRTRKNIESFGLKQYLADVVRGERIGIVPLDPLGYLDFLSLNDCARIVLTDSGGVQEEATVLGVPCLTLRDNTERPATGRARHKSGNRSGPGTHFAAGHAILHKPAPPSKRLPLWDGKAASRIVAIILEYLRNR